MMKTAALILVGLLGCGAARAAEPTFSPPEHDFSIGFAATPVAQSSFPHGKSDGGSRRYVAELDGQVFALTVDQYPAHIRVPAPTKEVYQRLLWAHADATGFALVSERPSLLSNLPCWEGVYRTADGRIEVRRVLMQGDSIYQVSETLADGVKDAASGEPFFSSFRIIASSLTLSRNVVGPLI